MVWPFGSSSSSASSSSSSLVPSTSTPPLPLSNKDAANPALNPLNPEGLKPCCACPETKKARDDCFLLYGSNADEGSNSSDKCKAIVDEHLKCMRSLGFNV
ncbi:cytochrome c oxidase copper chaperone [Pseudohyphozyma bogoriensis]|nr:cytochrome c oxidase copper chaperone [Pseudohyphozyma bogoriensis]